MPSSEHNLPDFEQLSVVLDDRPETTGDIGVLLEPLVELYEARTGDSVEDIPRVAKSEDFSAFLERLKEKSEESHDTTLASVFQGLQCLSKKDAWPKLVEAIETAPADDEELKRTLLLIESHFVLLQTEVGNHDEVRRFAARMQESELPPPEHLKYGYLEATTLMDEGRVDECIARFDELRQRMIGERPFDQLVLTGQAISRLKRGRPEDIIVASDVLSQLDVAIAEESDSVVSDVLRHQKHTVLDALDSRLTSG